MGWQIWKTRGGIGSALPTSERAIWGDTGRFCPSRSMSVSVGLSLALLCVATAVRADPTALEKIQQISCDDIRFSNNSLLHGTSDKRPFGLDLFEIDQPALDAIGEAVCISDSYGDGRGSDRGVRSPGGGGA